MAPPGITYYHDIEQGTPEWDGIRRGMITASAIKVLVTPTGKAANNDSSRAYLHQLLAERITGTSEAGYYSDDMARGHILEPLARDFYSRHYAPVKQCGFIIKNYGDFSIGYSPDGLVGGDGLIEIKCRLSKHHINTILQGQIPSEYVTQVQTGLAVSNREWIDYISFTPGLPFFTVRNYRDEKLIKAIEEAACEGEQKISATNEEYGNKIISLLPTEAINSANSDQILV